MTITVALKNNHFKMAEKSGLITPLPHAGFPIAAGKVEHKSPVLVAHGWIEFCRIVETPTGLN